ncbi:MAG: glycosyltransferase [Verrucomicrobia bacterium]|nr:glycosyltransferase [Verrucomicrobiota bacterium]
MPPASRTPPFGGAYSRRFTDYAGIYFDEFHPESAWVRECGTIHLPPLDGLRTLVLRGEFRPHPEARGLETPLPALEVRVDGHPAAAIARPAVGDWELTVALPASHPITLTFHLGGVAFTNFLAWLGRASGLEPLQRFRAQHKNRQLRLRSIATPDGEIIYDFSRRDAPYSSDYARRHAKLGLNIVGFLTADLGVGESARCMVRAADAAAIPTALVPLKLNCKNRLGDQTYAARLQDENPHDLNVVHLDPPASRDLDHHHGQAFRAGKYNIAYFAWELPEFPDAWVPSFDYYNEIWCPSDFTARAISMKSPLPVLTMPHAISFARPLANVGGASRPDAVAALRARFGLPADRFLFLTLFDFNSYAERKNPRAALEAFRRSGLASKTVGGALRPDSGAALVIKVQNAAGNPADFAALQASVRDLPGTVLLTETLSRADIYALEAACDCFVSLHRSEGYGLAVAESMFLGKPVISTDWSATAEFVTTANGCPVRAPLIMLEKNHGPYAKGSTWADPDPSHAAEWMQKLVADRVLAASLGAAARATIESRFSPAVIGARYKQRLQAIAAF